MPSGTFPRLSLPRTGTRRVLPGAVRVIEASHPVPDARSLAAGRALRTAVEAMAPGSRLLLLVSGGASALAEDLVEGATLEDLAALNRKAAGRRFGHRRDERRAPKAVADQGRRVAVAFPGRDCAGAGDFGRAGG
ncbi:DUF4147 domain-containing protein [Jhaorihella thermophila]